MAPKAASGTPRRIVKGTVQLFIQGRKKQEDEKAVKV